ncbi:MAG: hypothetical protein ACOC6C_01730 [Verrucomicrobiota bacterium]
MMNNTLVDVPKLKFSEPRHNLPGRKGIATAEDRFTIAFARAYFEQAPSIHHKAKRTQLALAREIPINGYGITDLLAVAWQEVPGEVFPNSEAFAEVVQPTVRAFEMKLDNWRKAIAQASRYKNFAHQAIAVVPKSIGPMATEYIETFRRIRVGLWLFDSGSGVIQPIYTPRPATPRSSRYRIESIHKAAQVAKSSLPIA